MWYSAQKHVYNAEYFNDDFNMQYPVAEMIPVKSIEIILSACNLILDAYVSCGHIHVPRIKLGDEYWFVESLDVLRECWHQSRTVTFTYLFCATYEQIIYY